MCRNIRILFNFDPPATDQEIHEASLQFVRKVSGFRDPSKINSEAFSEAVDEVSKASKHLLDHLKTDSPKRDREKEEIKAHQRAIDRFGR